MGDSISILLCQSLDFFSVFFYLYKYVFYTSGEKEKSGITEHYAHADCDDALTVAFLVVPHFANKICGISGRYLCCVSSVSFFKFKCH